MGTRKDIAALKQLMEDPRMNSLKFSALIRLMVDFIHDVLLADVALATPILRQQVATQCIAPARSFLLKQLDVNELERYRVKAWEYYDNGHAAARHLMRAAICCLYDEQTAEFDNYGAEAILETFLACLLDMNEKYCMTFSEYAINNLSPA